MMTAVELALLSLWTFFGIMEAYQWKVGVSIVMSIINVGLVMALNMCKRELEKEIDSYQDHCECRRLGEHRPEGAPEDLEVFRKHAEKSDN